MAPPFLLGHIGTAMTGLGAGEPSTLMQKLLAWRKQNGLYPVPPTGANGAGAGDASGDGASGR
jgi:hypothetical protein